MAGKSGSSQQFLKRKLVQREGAKRMTFALDQDDYVRLTTLAAKMGVKKHTLIEEAVVAYLDKAKA